MLRRLKGEHPIGQISQVVSGNEVIEAQTIVREVHVALFGQRVHCAPHSSNPGNTPTRALGASPRGSLALFRAVQAQAALHGRGYALPDDVKRMAHPVLAHRILVRPEASLRGVDGDRIVSDVLDSTPLELGAEDASM